MRSTSQEPVHEDKLGQSHASSLRNGTCTNTGLPWHPIHLGECGVALNHYFSGPRTNKTLLCTVSNNVGAQELSHCRNVRYGDRRHDLTRHVPLNGCGVCFRIASARRAVRISEFFALAPDLTGGRAAQRTCENQAFS